MSYGNDAPLTTVAPSGSSLIPQLSGLASAVFGGGGLAGLPAQALQSALADVPMSATSGGSYIASGPTIGAKVIGGKGVSAGTSATQDATASNASGTGTPGLPNLAALNPSHWSTGTIAAVAVGVLLLVAILFQPSRGK